jgi:hypothetical protein
MVPALIAQYRRHIPSAMLGMTLNPQTTIGRLITRLRAGAWTPYPDPNLVYVTGGYGRLPIIMRPEFKIPKTTWPVHSDDPAYLLDDGKFNVQLLRELAPTITMHSQEGPGLRQVFRTTPIPALQREWFIGLMDLYNDTCNGWGIHAWPPSWADARVNDPSWAKPSNFDETDFYQVVSERMKQPVGEPEKPAMDLPTVRRNLAQARRLIREAEAALGPNLTQT